MALTVQLNDKTWELFEAADQKHKEESRERLRREYEDKTVAQDERGVEGTNTERLTDGKRE